MTVKIRFNDRSQFVSSESGLCLETQEISSDFNYLINKQGKDLQYCKLNRANDQSGRLCINLAKLCSNLFFWCRLACLWIPKLGYAVPLVIPQYNLDLGNTTSFPVQDACFSCCFLLKHQQI